MDEWLGRRASNVRDLWTIQPIRRLATLHCLLVLRTGPMSNEHRTKRKTGYL